MDVVIFEVAGQRYALPAANISEVLDPVPVTPLPYAPTFVDGLVNVIGQVVVQMDAEQRLGVGGGLAALRGSILVVNDGYAQSAVHVERVLTKAIIADEDISRKDARVASDEDSDLIDSSEADHARFLSGSFQWKETSVLLLDVFAFSLDDIVPVGEPDGRGGMLGSAIGSIVRSDGQESRADKGFSCVIVQCNGEHYGIALHEVGEVVDEFKLTVLPHAPSDVSGMTLLRGEPVLSLSLGALLGGTEHALLRKMVVVERNQVRFGLLVEEVLGIEYFAEGSVQDVEPGAEVEGYLIGTNKGMIGLLGINGLISDARFKRYSDYLTKNNVTQSVAAVEKAQGKKVRMLAFFLGREQCAIPLSLVERVEEYREQIDLPGGREAGICGAVQIQGEVVPVVDLRGEFGGEQDDKDATYLVVRMEGGVWALTVNRVERVIEISESDIEQIKADKRDYIGAVGRLNGRLISIISLTPLMSADSDPIMKAA
jgi:chemotaxis signal transduction protein